jgi:hypothetical protein
MKLYVDSRFRTVDSASGSDFTIELLEPIALPPECKCRITNLTVPFSWYSVEELNQFLYMSEKNASNEQVYRVIVLPPGQYDGPRLATAIGSGMNANSIYGTTPYNVTYSDQRGTISIAALAPGREFTLYDDITLRGLDPWPFSGGGSPQQPRSFNRNLRLTQTQSFNAASPYTSEFVDLLGIKVLYLTSRSLGNLSNVGPRIGQRTCLASMPVTSSFGYVAVQDTHSGELQDTECGSQLLKRLDFTLEDATGAVVPLHGLDCSFTLSFDVR